MNYTNGSISFDAKRQCFFGRWREDLQMPDGVIVRKQRCVKLADYSPRYRSKRDVMPLLQDKLKTVAPATPHDSNGHGGTNMLLTQFVENTYLPYAENAKRASTIKGYKQVWKAYIKNRVEGLYVRDFRTVTGSRILKDIAADHQRRNKTLTKTTLGHIKSVLSAFFTFAKNEGYYDGVNPIQDVLIPPARSAGETGVYTLEEIHRMLQLFSGDTMVSAVLGVAGFAGLREAEIIGLMWLDYTGDALKVSRSVWRGHVSPPKTRKSAAPVPVIAPLKKLLDAHREAMKNPLAVTPIFPGIRQETCDLEKLASRIIRPVLESAGMTWKGWHAFRRGLASNLYALGVSDKVVQAILRHSKVTVTRDHYIQAFDADVLAAMSKLEQAVDAHCGATVMQS